MTKQTKTTSRAFGLATLVAAVGLAILPLGCDKGDSATNAETAAATPTTAPTTALATVETPTPNISTATTPPRKPADASARPNLTPTKPALPGKGDATPAKPVATQNDLRPNRGAVPIQGAAGATASPIVFEPSPLDLGEMTAGIAKTGIVIIRNTSEAAVTITKAIPGCGCTTLGWPKEPIGPGESAEIEVTLKPGPKQGIKLRKRVTFQLEGHTSQVLQVVGDVAAYVTITPDIIPARVEETELSGDIVLTAADGTPFAVTSVEPAVVADVGSETALTHTLNINWQAWEDAGRPVKVTFKTDHPKAVQVTALVKRRASTRKDGSSTLASRPPVPSINDLSGAARAGDIAKVKLLIEQGKDVNQSDKTGGRTPLHWAVRHDHADVMELLLASGADINKGDQAGKTPLSHAAENGKVELTIALIKAGADVNKRDFVGGNSVLWAAGLGTPETLKILVDAGGSVEVRDINGLTPLQWAAQTGKTDSMAILITGGADVNSQDNLAGETVLMRASRSGKIESINLLLTNNADPNKTTKLGANALHVASEYGSAVIVARLVEAGMDANHKDARGWNALDYAKNRVDDGRFLVIEFLDTKITPEPAETAETEPTVE